MVCQKCGKEFIEDWRKDKRTRKIKPLLFCSLTCSNSRLVSNEAKLKIKQGLVKHFADHPKIKDPVKNRRVSSYQRTREAASLLDVSSRTTASILKRMKLACSRCGWFVEGVASDIHHIVPRGKGGSNSHENLTLLCPNCHRLAHSGKIDSKELIPLTIQIGETWKEFYYIKSNGE